MATLSALVQGLDAELARLGYKDATMVWYRRCWRRMQEHFAARGAGEFSLDAAMAWVDDACGFFGKEQAGTLKPNDIYLFRVAAMLGEYAAHGAVLRRYNRWVSKLDGPASRRSPGSRRTCARLGARLRPCGPTGRWPGSSSRSPAPAAGWPAVTPPRSGRSSLRLRATVQDCRAETVRGAVVPAVRVRRRPGRRRVPGDGPGGTLARQARIPSVWDPGEVARIVEAIDRETRAGSGITRSSC